MKILEEYEADEELEDLAINGPKKFAFYVFNPDESGTFFCWHDKLNEAFTWMAYLTASMYFFYEEEMENRKKFLSKALFYAEEVSANIVPFEEFVLGIQKILSEFAEPYTKPFGSFAYLGRYEDLLNGNKEFERSVRARFRLCDMYDEWHEFLKITPPRINPKDKEIKPEELEVFSGYVMAMS